MQLTPEQQKRISEAKSAGERRVVLDFTSGQEAEWETAVQQELAGKDENLEHLRKMKAAARQEGFSGDLRRAITLARRPIGELAAEIGDNRYSFRPRMSMRTKADSTTPHWWRLWANWARSVRDSWCCGEKRPRRC